MTATVTIDVESSPIVRIDRPAPPVYDPDAVALFARFNETPSEARKQLISDRFIAGKATTWWSKLDALWVHAAHGAEAGRLNWLGPRYNCLPVNNPAFQPDRGYMGDGVSSYLDTQFNPATAVGAKFKLDSATLGVRSNTDNIGVGSLAGYWDGSKGTTINPRNTNNNRMTARVNQGTDLLSAGGSSPSSIGMFVATRESNLIIRGYRNGVRIIDNTNFPAAAQVANGSLRLGAISADSLRACQFCMGFIGAGMTGEEVLSVYDWFRPYATALGIV